MLPCVTAFQDQWIVVLPQAPPVVDGEPTKPVGAFGCVTNSVAVAGLVEEETPEPLTAREAKISLEDLERPVMLSRPEFDGE